MDFITTIKKLFKNTVTQDDIEKEYSELLSNIEETVSRELAPDILEELEELNNTPSRIAIQEYKGYNENYSHIDGYLLTFRQHQTEALEALNGKNIGQVTIPTGTGKSRIQVALHVIDMIEKAKNNETGVYVIGAHRLPLCTQLLQEIIETAVNCGIKFDVLYVGSEKYDDKKDYDNFKKNGFTKHVSTLTNSTKKADIIKAEREAKKNGRQLLVVSTYHSFYKLSNIPDITICTYDEAHTTLQDNFTDNIKKVKSNIGREFFFTATRKTLGDDCGMNDEEFYGPILYKKAPKEMYDKGEIIRPKVHSIVLDKEDDFDKKDYENKTMLYRVVTQGFMQHRKVLKSVSVFPDEIDAKLLVTFIGTKDMFELHNNPLFKQWAKTNEVDIYVVSSEKGNYINFNKTRRSKVMEKFKKGDDQIPDNKAAIILHVDILTEGIDLPSITAILPFRDLSKSKFLQNIGRATRLLEKDRVKFYTGINKANEHSKMIKPYAWVLFCEDIFVEHEQIKRLKGILWIIQNDYGVPFEEMMPDGAFKGKKMEEIEPITTPDNPNSIDKKCNIKHIIEDMILQRYYDEMECSPTPFKLLIDIMDKSKPVIKFRKK
jgi:superfamily II DNA or RNA helicase